jgi:hypothetical protein
VKINFGCTSGAGAPVRMEEYTDVAELRALCVILGLFVVYLIFKLLF